MKRRNLVVTAPGQVTLAEEEMPELSEGDVLLRTRMTGLSAGTELAFVKGDHPGLAARMDRELGLFLPNGTDSGYPVTRLGYMEVAEVADSHTSGFQMGERVAAAYGHATAHVADPVREHLVPLPDDLDPLLGVYVAHLGPICANGLLHAAFDATGGPVNELGDGVAGRRVVVTGGGLIGLLTATFAAEHGAYEVVVLDVDPRRRQIAEAMGFLALDMAEDPGLILKRRWRHGPGDHGADVVFQCRGRPPALAVALRAVRPRGTVVDLAFYTEGADEVRLGEEFHHNGLTLRCAQIGRLPRTLDSSWDRQRLSAETVHLLRRRGRDIRDQLITDVLPLDDAPALLNDIAAHRRHVLSVIFTVDDGPGIWSGQDVESGHLAPTCL